MKNSKRLVFFGNERLATAVDTKAPILRRLVEEGYEITGVIASLSSGLSRRQRHLEIVEVAHAYHIPVFNLNSAAEVLNKVKEIGADAGVLAAYGKILPAEIINLFPAGIINVHPSLLPAYRGPTPVENAILDGASRTGVSIMKLVPKMDSGPIYAQAGLGLSGRETKAELAESLGAIGADLLAEHLPAILDGSLSPKPQNDQEATYTKLLIKADGRIDWRQDARLIERQIRAYLGFPRSRAVIFGKDVIITRAQVVKSPQDGILVQAANPGFIEILELIAPSGRAISGAEFIRGYSKS